MWHVATKYENVVISSSSSSNGAFGEIAENGENNKCSSNNFRIRWNEMIEKEASDRRQDGLLPFPISYPDCPATRSLGRLLSAALIISRFFSPATSTSSTPEGSQRPSSTKKIALRATAAAASGYRMRNGPENKKKYIFLKKKKKKKKNREKEEKRWNP